MTPLGVSMFPSLVYIVRIACIISRHFFQQIDIISTIPTRDLCFASFRPSGEIWFSMRFSSRSLAASNKDFLMCFGIRYCFSTLFICPIVCWPENLKSAIFRLFRSPRYLALILWFPYNIPLSTILQIRLPIASNFCLIDLAIWNLLSAVLPFKTWSPGHYLSLQAHVFKEFAWWRVGELIH
jgi:hypothetical protein